MLNTARPHLRDITAADFDPQQPQELLRLVDLARSYQSVQCLRRAMEHSDYRNDLRSACSTWPRLAAYTARLAALVTDVAPGTTPTLTLLQEVLESACVHYLSAGPTTPPNAGPARFMAAGISACARGWLTYTVSGRSRTAAAHEWTSYEGSIVDWAERRDIERLSFRPRALARPEERHAMRAQLADALLGFEDLVLITRVGIDYHTFEAL